MPSGGDDTSPDHVRLDVDGQVFDVSYDPDQPGAYHYLWANGPNEGYGFTSRRSDRGRSTIAEHERDIREFLSAVDPSTGYIEDDDS